MPSLTSCYSNTIRQDKAAVLAYLRMKHKDRLKGYVLCAVVSFVFVTWYETLTVCLTLVSHRRAKCHCRKRFVR